MVAISDRAGNAGSRFDMTLIMHTSVSHMKLFQVPAHPTIGMECAQTFHGVGYLHVSWS